MHAQLDAQARTHAANEKASRQLLGQAGAQVTAAVREHGIERARAEALEVQLSKLQDVAAAMEAAIHRGATSKTGKRGSKSASVGARKGAKIGDIGQPDGMAAC